MTENASHWFRLLLGISLLITGCGEGDEPAPPEAGRNVRQRRAPAIQPPRPKSVPTEDKPPAESAPAGREIALAGERFEVLQRQPNFEILDPEVKGNEANRFAVRSPLPGTNSSSFQVAEPGDEAGASQPNPNLQLPEGFTPLTDAGYSEKGLPLRIRCERDGAVMALVPAGVFRMGTDDGPSNVSPAMTVYLDPYYIDVTEVTVEQFQTYRDSVFKTQRRFRPPPENADAPPDHPVLGVSWGEARFYARWAGKELPTEAQWEKAGRGPDGDRYPWGNGRPIWPGGRTTTQIDPVRSFRTDRSRYGVFDLAGNAREWCRDFYSGQAYQEAVRESASSVLRNWPGPDRPSQPHRRLVKGNGADWSLWHRRGRHMNEPGSNVGFRCVLPVPLPDAADPP